MDNTDMMAPVCHWCGVPGDDGEQGRLVRGKDHELYHFGCLHKAEELEAMIKAIE
jgi:hypothetical protein